MIFLDLLKNVGILGQNLEREANLLKQKVTGAIDPIAYEISQRMKSQLPAQPQPFFQSAPMGDMTLGKDLIQQLQNAFIYDPDTKRIFPKFLPKTQQAFEESLKTGKPIDFSQLIDEGLVIAGMTGDIRGVGRGYAVKPPPQSFPDETIPPAGETIPNLSQEMRNQQFLDDLKAKPPQGVKPSVKGGVQLPKGEVSEGKIIGKITTPRTNKTYSIYKNPSREIVNKMAFREADPLKAFIDQDGNVYGWKSVSALHTWAAEQNPQLKNMASVEIYPGGQIEFTDYNQQWMNPEGGLEGYDSAAKIVKKAESYLKKILDKDATIQLSQWDEDIVGDFANQAWNKLTQAIKGIKRYGR